MRSRRGGSVGWRRGCGVGWRPGGAVGRAAGVVLGGVGPGSGVARRRNGLSSRRPMEIVFHSRKQRPPTLHGPPKSHAGTSRKSVARTVHLQSCAESHRRARKVAEKSGEDNVSAKKDEAQYQSAPSGQGRFGPWLATGTPKPHGPTELQRGCVPRALFYQTRDPRLRRPMTLLHGAARGSAFGKPFRGRRPSWICNEFYRGRSSLRSSITNNRVDQRSGTPCAVEGLALPRLIVADRQTAGRGPGRTSGGPAREAWP